MKPHLSLFAVVLITGHAAFSAEPLIFDSFEDSDNIAGDSPFHWNEISAGREGTSVLVSSGKWSSQGKQSLEIKAGVPENTVQLRWKEHIPTGSEYWLAFDFVIKDAGERSKAIGAAVQPITAGGEIPAILSFYSMGEGRYEIRLLTGGKNETLGLSSAGVSHRMLVGMKIEDGNEGLIWVSMDDKPLVEARPFTRFSGDGPKDNPTGVQFASDMNEWFVDNVRVFSEKPE